MGDYQKFTANKLPVAQQSQLRSALQEKLVDDLIKAIKDNPPEVHLEEIELVLRPGMQIAGWDTAADCGTCGTCATCATCATCVTSCGASDIPVSVINALKIQNSRINDFKRLSANVKKIKVPGI